MSNWRRFLAAVMVLSLAACGAKDTPAGLENSNAEAQKDKDTVIIAIGDEPSTLDPTNGWGQAIRPLCRVPWFITPQI
jgi:ABC-type transport system substrate-binding protein